MEEAKLRKLMKLVEELSGERVSKCIHCGVCSSTCMFSSYKGVKGPLPRRINKYIEISRAEITELPDLQLCVACGSCRVRCPMDINIPRVMEAVQWLVMGVKGDFVDTSKIPEERLLELPQVALVATSCKLTKSREAAAGRIKRFPLRGPQQRPEKFELSEEYAEEVLPKRV
jgi:Fe-S oxidoreductase